MTRLRTPAGALATMQAVVTDLERRLPGIQAALTANDPEQALRQLRDLVRHADEEADWAATQLFDGDTAH